MTALFVPDNTVLVNFAKIRRMDLLRFIVQDNGKWCGTIAEECNRSARVAGLEDISEAHGIFGEPMRLMTQCEIVDTTNFRTSFAAPGDSSRMHLGEAETLSILVNRGLDAAFVTDDKAAARRALELNITTYTTWDILKLAVVVGLLDVQTAFGYVVTLDGARHGFTHLRSRVVFIDWCAN